jgi:acyl-CoA dehydrogenase
MVELELPDEPKRVRRGVRRTTSPPIERLWRDQRSHMITEGTPDLMRVALARHGLKPFG